MLTSAVLGLWLVVALVSARAAHSDFGSFSNSGSLSQQSTSTESSTSSSSSTSSENREERARRDQRRIELAVQDALLATNVNPAPAFPQHVTYLSKSYQISFTTVCDRLPDDSIGNNQLNPVFGPVAVLSYTSPNDGMWGPSRTRAQVIALDTSTNFGVLFNEVRRAGFLGEFDLRTLVQSDLTFDLRSPALVTPCFPVTDEPALQIELIVLLQNARGQLRRKWLAIERFFDDNHGFVDGFIEEIEMSRYSEFDARFEETEDKVAIMTVGPCDQYSYFQ